MLCVLFAMVGNSFAQEAHGVESNRIAVKDSTYMTYDRQKIKYLEYGYEVKNHNSFSVAVEMKLCKNWVESKSDINEVSKITDTKYVVLKPNESYRWAPAFIVWKKMNITSPQGQHFKDSGIDDQYYLEMHSYEVLQPKK